MNMFTANPGSRENSLPTDVSSDEHPFSSLHTTAAKWQETAELLRAKGDLPGAISAYTEAVALDAGDAGLLRTFGAALVEAGDTLAAITAFRSAACLQPDCADVFVNLGVLLYEAGSVQESIECQKRAVMLEPGLTEALSNLGIALRADGRAVEAEEVLRKAVATNDCFGPAHYNLGCVLFDQGDLIAAEHAFRKAVELMPASAAAHTNLGLALYRKQDNEGAISSYREALALHPDFVDAHWNLSHALLRRGDLGQGWSEFEWRWKKPEFQRFRENYPFPDWDGRAMPGASLLVFAEQGLGDLFQFVRFLPLLAERRVRVIVEAPAGAAELVGRIAGVTSVVIRGEPLPPVDACCGLLSLPYLLGSNGLTVPSQVPYLHPPERTAVTWQQRMQSVTPSLRVGIVWAGSSTNPAGKYRSMRLEEFEPVFGMPGIQFFSLQKGGRVNDLRTSRFSSLVIDWSDDLHDFSDTAGLIQCLDLVISVDTAVAHLAGALGKRAWTLLPAIPDWRWHQRGSAAPWYPTMRLYRQARPGDWADLMQNVRADLTALVTGGRVE